MELSQAVKGRRSVRAYRDLLVPDSVINRVIDLARYAPSSMNGQPLQVVVIRNEATKAAISEIKDKYCPVDKLKFKAGFLKLAPVVLVVCVDRDRSFARDIENGVLATATIMLAAYAEGLGSVYMSASKSDEPGLAEEISRLLGLPGRIVPVNIIPLGYPAESPVSRNLIELEEVVHYESF